MSPLDATFTLTPGNPCIRPITLIMLIFFVTALIFTTHPPRIWYRSTRATAFFFDGNFAADAALDYTQWANRKKARLIECHISLRSYTGTQKQLALVFAFYVDTSPAILVKAFLSGITNCRK